MLHKLIRLTPKSVIRGIQLALGISLVFTCLNRIQANDIVIGILSIALILFWGKSDRVPVSLLLMALGILLMILQNDLHNVVQVSFELPAFSPPSSKEIYEGFLLAGIAQMPLTLSNAVIATAALIREYFPEEPREKISEKI